MTAKWLFGITTAIAALWCSYACAPAQAADCYLSRPSQGDASAPPSDGAGTVELATGEIGRIVVVVPNGGAGTPSIAGSALAKANWAEILPVPVAANVETRNRFDRVAPLGESAATGGQRRFLLRLHAQQSGKGKLAVSFNSAGHTAQCGTVNLDVLPVRLPAANLTIEAEVWPDNWNEAQIANTLRLLQDNGFNAFGRVWRPDDPQTLRRLLENANQRQPIKSFRVAAAPYITSKSPQASLAGPDAERWVDDNAQRTRAVADALRPLSIPLAYEVWDEPTRERADTLENYVRGMKAKLPGMTLQITAPPFPVFRNQFKPDIWIAPDIELSADYIAAAKADGSKVWLYANRQHGVDNAPTAMRSLGWIIWAKGLDGYYLWGANRGEVRANEQSDQIWTRLQRANFVYRTRTNAIDGSMRLEMFQQGLQDYALLKLADRCSISDPDLRSRLDEIRQTKRVITLQDLDLPSLHDRVLGVLANCR